MLIPLLLVGLISLIVSLLFTSVLIPRLARAGICGKDENKADAPQIPEMGGIGIIAGFSAGMLIAIFASTFAGLEFDLVLLLAAIITIHTIAFIGIVDDLLSIPQWLKAILPLFAAVPLVAVKAAGSTAIALPLLGIVDFGLIYTIALIPLAIAVCSNLTNMFAGFNGMESGLGAVIFGALALIGMSHGEWDMVAICVSMLFALLGFLAFNRFPAKVFPGDVGNLTIGVAVASAIIIGNLESAGVILMIPYMIDFVIKALNRFPHTYQEVRAGKLLPKDGRVRGLVHVPMKLADGISERALVLLFLSIEGAFALIALAMYYRF